MDLEYRDRIIRLELRQDNTDHNVSTLQTTSSETHRSLVGIERTLLQIKWLTVGAVMAIVGKSLGLEKLVALLL